MRWLHEIKQGDIIGDRSGFFVEKANGARTLFLIVTMPLPGRWTCVEDYEMAVILRARCVAQFRITLFDHILPPIRWRDQFQFDIRRRSGETKDLRRTVRLYEAMP